MKSKFFTRNLLLLSMLFVSITAWGDTTYKLTQVTEVAAGNKYVFVENGNALTTVDKDKKAIKSTTTFSTTGLTGTEAYVWSLESTTGGFYMKMSDNKYLNNSSGTDMKAENSGSSVWTFSFTAGVALISNSSNSNRFIGNNGENYYKAYATSGLDTYPHNFTVYQVEEDLTPATYTVTYHVGDNNYNVNRDKGETLSLDDPAAIGGMDFAGWSSSDDVTAPVWVANSTTVKGDMELYAFFTIVAPTEGYYLVEASQDDWRGDYLIAYSSTLFADGRKGGKDGDGIAAENVKVNPGSHLNGKVVDTEWGDTYNVSILAVNENNLAAGYVLQTKDGKYNYCTESSSTWTTTTTKGTANNHPMTISFNSSSDISLQIHTYYVRYNESNHWFHFYTSGYEPVYLYKRQGMPGVYSLGKSKGVTITTAKYATYCSDEGLDFSGTGAKVYKAKVTGSSVKLTEITGGIVPANTGVMVYKDVAATENLSVPVTLTDATVTDNELVGITEETTVPWTADGKYNYILQKQTGDETPKFYKATGKKLMTNRAYLSTTYNVASGRGLDIVFEGEEEEGDVTGVVSVARPQATNNHCYDLQGCQVMQPTQKGLFIVNGKKYVVK